ncbi:MAG: hypothetical protein SWX82_09550 [Cyanobacteriota bacterium]|nr:hypothetical protein [Cyanobacteriota bacterium]
MKIAQIIIIFLVACLTILIGHTKQAISNSNHIVEAQAQSQAKPIPISLPVKARVILKDGDSRSGKLTEINSQHLTITRGGSSRREAIANVTEIEFYRDISRLTSRGSAIRGDKVEMKGKPRRFQVQMDGLEWENIEKGIAKIKPEALVGVDDRKGIPRPFRNIIKSRYIVSKIEFQQEQQMLIITAISHSREEE